MEFSIKAFLGAGIFALAASSAHAYQVETIHNKKGEVVFEARLYGPGDGSYSADPSDPAYSVSEIDDNGRRKIRAGLERWAEILTITPGYRPAIINVGTVNVYNAYAYSQPGEDPSSAEGLLLSSLQGALLNLLDEDDVTDAHAVIAIGTLPWDTAPVTPSQLPLTGKADYSAIAFHELAHPLGILSLIDRQGGAGATTPFFAEAINRWAAGLRDDNGNPARPAQAVLCVPCGNPYDAGAFDLRKDNGYFTGPHVREVLNGAMPGVPISALMYHDHPHAGVDDDYLNHSELRNSLMSHQRYRNYTNFMEAELAIFQDLGLTIDRRNFFGYSVYGDNITLTNRNGFFARNADGTAYLPGQYNRATQGLGLHIYGERNTITQAADLLSAGPGGVGVRVDGSENTLIVPQGTRIHAHGWYGRGLQFSYGRHHNIVQQGEVRADGADGVGALFDFGHNAMGDEGDYRGSWLRTAAGQYFPVPEILQGALVSNYDLSGPLSGRTAAIRIADNAWVRNINIMQGASIRGDIVSDYPGRDPNQVQRLTRVSFGQKADAQGRASAQPDAGFNLRYDGNIRGGNSLDVSIDGGLTSLNGTHDLHGLRVAPGATLGGNSTYAINPEGRFINDGTLSPGNSFGQITIQGNFVQGPQGRTQIEASTTGHDRIEIQGIAQLAGELNVQLQPDWYANGWSLSQDEIFQATQTTGRFDLKTSNVAASPTLIMLAANDTWTVMRSSAAYAQYAANPNAAAAGRSLAQANAGAQRPLAGIYQALDFSRTDGSDIRSALDQLSGGAYGAQLAASLRREQLVSEQLRQRTGAGKEGWNAFIQPFGSRYRWQLGSNDVDHRSDTYGVVFGAEHSAASSDWRLGVHATANEQRLSMDAPHRAKSTLAGLGAGVHALYRADARQGWTGAAQLRAGLEQGKMNRRLDFAGHQASLSSDWTGHTLAAGVQAGYSWPLGEAGSFGPVAALDYLRYSRPSLREDSSAASRLHVDSTRADALQASLGMAARQSWELKTGQRLQAEVSAAWEQPLLGRKQTQHARFDASPQIAFDGRYARVDDHALALRADVKLHASDTLSLGASAGTRLLGNSRSDFSGNLSLNWRF